MAVGGVAVAPGDIVLGDADGVVIVPLGEAEQVLQGAEAKYTDETARRNEIQGGPSMTADTHPACAPRCIGLGEAGAHYATALLDAGYTVTGFDPGPVTTPPGVNRVGAAAEAVQDVPSRPRSAQRPRRPDPWLQSCSAALAPGACSRGLHLLIARRDCATLPTLVEQTGAVFCDVAILGPVSWYGAKTPLMIAGRSAAPHRRTRRQLGRSGGARGRPTRVGDGAQAAAQRADERPRRPLSPRR